MIRNVQFNLFSCKAKQQRETDSILNSVFNECLSKSKLLEYS